METSKKAMTTAQELLIKQLMAMIATIMVVDLAWASSATTTQEASEVIDLLKGISHLIKEVAILRKAGRINNDQIEAIRAKINGRPTMQWVNDAHKKLNYIKFS